MEIDKTLQAILERLDAMSSNIEELKDGFEELRDGQKALEIGQRSIRRDIAKLDRKLELLASEVGQTLTAITETTDRELNNVRGA